MSTTYVSAFKLQGIGIKWLGVAVACVAMFGCGQANEPSTQTRLKPVPGSERTTFFLREFQGQELDDSWIVLTTEVGGPKTSEFTIAMRCPEILAFSKGSAITTSEANPLDEKLGCDATTIRRFDELRLLLREAASKPDQQSSVTVENYEAIFSVGDRRIATFRRLLEL